MGNIFWLQRIFNHGTNWICEKRNLHQLQTQIIFFPDKLCTTLRKITHCSHFTQISTQYLLFRPCSHEKESHRQSTYSHNWQFILAQIWHNDKKKTNGFLPFFVLFRYLVCISFVHLMIPNCYINWVLILLAMFSFRTPGKKKLEAI